MFGIYGLTKVTDGSKFFKPIACTNIGSLQFVKLFKNIHAFFVLYCKFYKALAI